MPSSCSKSRRRRPRRQASRNSHCSRYRQGLTPHCMHRSSVTSRGSRTIKRRCRIFALPAPAAERTFLCALRPSCARRNSYETRSRRKPPTAPRRVRPEREGWPFCSPGRHRSIRAWARSSIVSSRYSERKSIAVQPSSATVLERPLIDVLFGDHMDGSLIDRNGLHPAGAVRGAGGPRRAVALLGHRS